MKVEYNQNEARPVKKNQKRKRKIRKAFVAVMAIVLVLAVTVALMLTVFFNVSEIKVVGSSIYSKEDIVYASGIMDGDNLIRLSAYDIEQRIEESLPYIKNAEVKKAYPNGIGIEVTPAKEALLLETQDGMYICDADYKILRSVKQSADGLLRIKGLSFENGQIGKTIEFADKQQRDVLSELLTICSDKGFNVTYVNIESMVNISFAIDDELYIKLGSYTDMGAKLTHLVGTLKEIDEGVTASISLESWSSTHKEAILKYQDITELIK